MWLFIACYTAETLVVKRTGRGIVMINSNIIMRIDSLLTRFAVLSRMVSRVWYCLPVDNGALVVVVVVRNSVCTSKRYIC